MKQWLKIIKTITIALIITAPAVCLAGSVALTNPLGDISDPRVLIGRLISAALGIVGSIALAVFIYGGFMWMTSAGSEEKVTKGKNMIIWASLGLAVIFASYALVKFILTAVTGGEGGQTGPNPGQTGQNP